MTINEFPFEKEKDESELAWAACLTYCLMSPDTRSIKDAQEIFYRNSKVPSRDKNHASRGWETWSSKFKWKDRASKIDTKKALDIIDAEKQLWIETRKRFNKIGDVKQQTQLKLEVCLTRWLEDNPNVLATKARNEKGEVINHELINDPKEVLGIIGEAFKVFKMANESDRILYDRFLKSIGIESLIPD
jgi:hypothetical protein